MVMAAKHIVQAVNHTSKYNQHQRSQFINFLELEDTKTTITCEAAPVQARSRVDTPDSVPLKASRNQFNTPDGALPRELLQNLPSP